MENNDKQADFKKRAEEFDNKLKELLDKYQLTMTATIDFPMYRELPDEVKLALLVINNHKGTFVSQYRDTKE